MSKVAIVMDTQTDLMNPDGALAVPGADALLADLRARVLREDFAGRPVAPA